MMLDKSNILIYTNINVFSNKIESKIGDSGRKTFIDVITAHINGAPLIRKTMIDRLIPNWLP